MDAFAFEQLEPAAPRLRSAGASVDDETIAAVRAAVEGEVAQTAEAVRADAREAGRREGLEAGGADVQAALAALASAVAELGEERARHAEVLEREAVELALQIAEKVVCGALEVQPERVLDVVRGSLRRVIERERVTVLVNPDDLAAVREAAGSLTGALGGIDRLEIQEERRVPRGGCVLRTADGEIDARIDAQLDRAREVIATELGG